MRSHFTLEFWKDDDWYVGRLKEVPGVFSQGENLEELEANIQDAYHLMQEEESNIGISADIQSKDIEVEV